MANEQEILVNFIGSNYGLMKNLDDQIIGSSSTLQRRSEDVKKVLGEALRSNIAPQMQQNIPQAIHQIHQPQQVIQPQQVVQTVVIPQQDDGQLWLSFDERDKVYDLLDSIIEKQDLILKRLDKIESSYTISRKRGL
jgi:hypothetical protein